MADPASVEADLAAPAGVAEPATSSLQSPRSSNALPGAAAGRSRASQRSSMDLNGGAGRRESRLHSLSSSIAHGGGAEGGRSGSILGGMAAVGSSASSVASGHAAAAAASAAAAAATSVHEMPQLIERLRSVLTLGEFQPGMWTQQHDLAARSFLTGDEHRRMFAYVQNKALVLAFALPASTAVSIGEVQFFVRDADVEFEPITLANFGRRVQFGCVPGISLQSLLRLMQGVYVPLLSENHAWPNAVRKDFVAQLDRFMTYLTDATHQLQGRTVLYIPNDDLSDADAAGHSKEVVQRLESILVHWTRQIKEVMNNQHASETAEGTGLGEEIAFWKSRCEDLYGINVQLGQAQVQRIAAVLQLAKSAYLEQFLRLSASIHEGTEQAMDNLKYLSALAEPCQQLAAAEPRQMPAVVPLLLQSVRFIWANARFYSTRERITGLLRKISNEVIRRCTSKIRLEEVFHGNVVSALAVLQDAIACGEALRTGYSRMAAHVARFAADASAGAGPWDFDESSIFAQLDAFVQRCRDLLEVGEATIQFARKTANGAKVPVPLFAGSQGPQIAKELEEIDVAFGRLVENLWRIRDSILDVKVTRWHDDYNAFKQGIKDIEVMTQNMISAAFEVPMTVTEQVQLLEMFHFLAVKESVKRIVERRAADVVKAFLGELGIVREQFENYRRTPEILRWHPDAAGSAFWAQALLRRIQQPWQCLCEAYWLPCASALADARSQYEPMVLALEEHTAKAHGEWAATVPRDIAQRLTLNLMQRVPATNALRLKFDHELLCDFGEAHYWQKLHQDVPFHMQDVVARDEELRELREHVVLVVHDYNGILASLPQDEAPIFRERIRFVDRKIAAGLSTLTWNSAGVTEFFVRETRRHCQELQTLVTHFSQSDAASLQQCAAIAALPLWQVEAKNVYDVEAFETARREHCSALRSQLAQTHRTMRDSLLAQISQFAGDGPDVQAQWLAYAVKLDRGVETALRAAVRASLQELQRSIVGERGKSGTGSQPPGGSSAATAGASNAADLQSLFRINVVLEGAHVDFSPPLQRVESCIMEAAHELISVIESMPRLGEIVAAQVKVEAPATGTFYEQIAREDDVKRALLAIQNGVAGSAKRCQEYLHNWDGYRELWEINKDAFIRRYAKLKPVLSTFDADINRYNEVANNIQKEETLRNVGFVRLDCSPLKQTLVSHCNVWQNKLTTLLNNNAESDLQSLHKLFRSKTEQLARVPRTLDELAEAVATVAQLQADLPQIDAQFGPVHEQFKILEKYEVQLGDGPRQLLEELHPAWVAFQQVLAAAATAVQEHKTRFRQELSVDTETYAHDASALRADFAARGPLNAQSTTVAAAQLALGEYGAQLQRLTQTERMLQKGYGIFQMTVAPNRDVEVLRCELDVLSAVWAVQGEWQAAWEGADGLGWQSQAYDAVDLGAVEELCTRLGKRCAKLAKDVRPEWRVFTALRDRLAQVKLALPVLALLRGAALRARHWERLMDATGRPFDYADGALTLGRVLELGLEQHGEVVEEISASAAQELSMEKQLDAISEVWRQVQFELSPHKERYYCVAGTEKIFETLEDNQVTLTALKASRHYAAFRSQVDHWEQALATVIEAVELLLQVQRQWLYLENIFVGAEDIRKQLPLESVQFDAINAAWGELMAHTQAQSRNVLAVTQTPGLVDRLGDLLARLERVQRTLDMYLETKRQLFPRFYFLSNDDLLEVLGQARDPHAVQPHLKKCFDGLHRLEVAALGTDAHRRFEARGMVAPDGEVVPFAAAVSVEGAAEAWLADVEAAMRHTLRKQLAATVGAFSKSKRDKWLHDWPGQLLITAALVQWTAECQRALADASRPDGRNALRELRHRQAGALKRLADLVETPLSPVDRRKLIALLTVQVHARDVVERLYRGECVGANAFEWISQLRFYWDRDLDDCVVRQINSQFVYAYEYLGNSGRLVVTPLTDRCFMTLTTALSLCRGGSPQGPAGTGKTETVKDLGKALGKLVLVVNCSDALDYRSLGRMFSGLVQTGAWGCFDEFNRIDVEVLSVVALQVSCILDGVAARASTLLFEEQQIRLNASVGLFITMNPGYAGRSELPDNLKSLFRPVAMSVPDTVQIAEIMLYAEGFGSTRTLARKVDTLYRIAAQQLSKQDHYDFGLRAITSALRAAGSLRRVTAVSSGAPAAAAGEQLAADTPDDALASTSRDEAVLYTTLRNAMLPKLTAEDAPLFSGLVADLFPGVEALPAQLDELKAAATAELREKQLQATPHVLAKVLQLHETQQSRHGVMLVGDTGSGKSTVLRTLTGALNRIHQATVARGGTGTAPVRTVALNPKALTLGELYGRYASGEWVDGVLASVMRTACSDERPDGKLIVLDGPVDTLWIESMNSVLDDNKLLTLTNGERIALPPQVGLVFEVRDLAAASPATVSRCGMVYFDTADLGWRPFLDTWLSTRPASAKLGELVGKFFERAFAFRQGLAPGDEVVPVPALSVVRLFCQLYDSIAARSENGLAATSAKRSGEKSGHSRGDEADDDEAEKMVELWFLFCLVWAFGASLTDDARRKFDMFVRELESQFPSRNTVFDYAVDRATRSWVAWETRLPNEWRAGETLVPTVETLRTEFVVRHLVRARAPVLLAGGPGSGKTVAMQTVLKALVQEDPSGQTVMPALLSALTTPAELQELIESQLERRTMNSYAPRGGRQLTVFLDDLNMPSRDAFGAQPALELLRQWTDYGQWYDRQKLTPRSVSDVLLVGAMGPPGGGRNALCPRVQSRFSVLHCAVPRDSSLQRIYATILGQRLLDFEEGLKSLGATMATATVDLLHCTSAQLLPTPARPHYQFSMHDLSRVFQGLLRADRDYHDSRELLTRLWVHEVCRVFHDRLQSLGDRDVFLRLVDERLAAHFGTSLRVLCPPSAGSNARLTLPLMSSVLQLPIRGASGDADDETTPEPDPSTALYEELEQDPPALKSWFEDRLAEYNQQPGCVRSNIVLFRDAVLHLLQMTRVLATPGGHLLLLGVGGSGRRSLARLAAHVCYMHVAVTRSSRAYRRTEFREDLRQVFRDTGVAGKRVMLLLGDQQLGAPEIMEDVQQLLSGFAPPGLFAGDELASLRSDFTKKTGAALGADATEETVDAAFSEAVRARLHLVLGCSPVGHAFRERLRLFPALLQHTTVCWFLDWPEDALLEVGTRYVDTLEELGTQKAAVAQMFVHLHTTSAAQAERMAAEVDRRVHMTPASYMELVSGFSALLRDKRAVIGALAQKLRSGLGKLQETKENVAKISVELEQSKRQVATFQKQCEDYLVVIVQQKREGDEQAKMVVVKAEKLRGEEEEVRKEAELAQADLDQAMPALLAATKALEAINKKDLGEIKSYGKPPPLVEKVLEAVMVLRKCEPTWDEAKRQLGNPNFVRMLVEFDKDNISDKILKRVSQYCSDESFQPDVVGRVSGAARSLCMWVRAMETYGLIYRQVAPKRENLRAAQETLERKQRSLREAREKLAEVTDKLAELQTQYDAKVALKDKLRREAAEMETRLERAEKLVTGLAAERERWEASVAKHEAALELLPGDCLLASASLAYLGAFGSAYRQRLQSTWAAQLKTVGIGATTPFALDAFLGEATEMREWTLNGLPADPFSLETALIATRGRRWPMMVDPQGQASRWVTAMESGHGLVTIDAQLGGSEALLRQLEHAVQFGTPVLLHNTGEELEPALDPLLTRAVVKRGGSLFMRLGEREVEYNSAFALYVATKLPNPRYAPDVYSKMTVVNFAVKERGLEDQLLATVVRRERPELEEQKGKLVVSVAQARRRLVELEDEILQLLATAHGSLLDNEKLVTALQTSKATAEQVTMQIAVSETTERSIDTTREGYRPCARRASVLFFVVNDLALVDPMYQFPLDRYVELFDDSIARSPRHDDLKQRIASLNDFHTHAVFAATCRGLFQRHRLLFAVHMAARILEAAGKWGRELYDFFLRGGVVLDREAQLPNAYAEWIPDAIWDNLTELERLAPQFQGLGSALERAERDWKAWRTGPEPETAPVPGEWDDRLSDLERLVLLRAMRPDRVVFAARRFVSSALGERFASPESGPADLEGLLQSTPRHIPVLFVLSPGVDPSATLMALAASRGMAGRLHRIALGQGQSPRAAQLLRDGAKAGDWVFLANCDLSLNWLATLEQLVLDLTATPPHPDFRLWLSSSPTPRFPISLLQLCTKVTTEPPDGLRATLERLYVRADGAPALELQQSVAAAVADGSPTPGLDRHASAYRKLFFALCFYHATLLERKKYRSLGWNSPADFGDSDLTVSNSLLALLLAVYPDVPWDALRYLVAEVNYGGRVTDDWDRRVLTVYADQLLAEPTVATPLCALSSVSGYHVPADGQDPLAYVRSLPPVDRPEIYGQHANADVASQLMASDSLLQTLLTLQSHSSGGTGAPGAANVAAAPVLSREERVQAVIADLQRRVPEQIDLAAAQKLVSHDLSNPLNVVLLHEIQRYNELLHTVNASLALLDRAISGLVLMTPDLEAMLVALFEGRVPAQWSAAYGSIKPLGTWIRDLALRVAFFAEWGKGTEPILFWLGAFTSPTSLLSAALQRAARKANVPMDALAWDFQVLQVEDEAHVTAPPKDGIYIRGITLEGAGWDRKNACLRAPLPMELSAPMPPIHLRLVENKRKPPKGVYVCPLYYYPIRAGTRERPSFTIALELKTGGHEPALWIKRGAAAFATSA